MELIVSIQKFLQLKTRNIFSSGAALWIDCRYAPLIAADFKNMKKLVFKNRNSSDQKVVLYAAVIYPILHDEPVAFIDDLAAFNLSNRGIILDDALIEVSSLYL